MKSTLSLACSSGSSEREIIFGKPYIGNEEIDEVVATLRSGWVGTGQKVLDFEKRFCEYCAVKHSIALSSCSAALHLALIAAGVGEGDEVITTPMTFAATANAIVHQGAKPVFVDVRRETMTIDAQQIEQAITPRTKAILPVDMAGRPCDFDAIMDLAKRNHIIVIEDAAHAVEAWYQGRKIGSVANLTTFSFYATKSICTAEGGMLTTDSEEYAETARRYQLHGLTKDAWRRYASGGQPFYDVVVPGYKYNMTDIQAALGVHQLARVERNWAVRSSYWKLYDEGLDNVPGLVRALAPLPTESRHALHLYTIFVDHHNPELFRTNFVSEMRTRGIGTGVHYLPLHLSYFYRNTYGYRPGDYPEAEWLGSRTVSLPLTAAMTKEDVMRVIMTTIESLAVARRRS